MTKQITEKDPKAVERGKKSWETQLEKIKTKHLEEIKNGGNATGDATGNTSSATGNTSNTTGNKVLVGAAVALTGIAVLFLWKRNTSNPTPQRVAKPENDIFRMN